MKGHCDINVRQPGKVFSVYVMFYVFSYICNALSLDKYMHQLETNIYIEII